jgi:hypothetical protein
VETRVTCRPCVIADFLAEEAFRVDEDFSAGIRMWHDKCKRKNCDCQVDPRERTLLRHVRSLAHAESCHDVP